MLRVNFLSDSNKSRKSCVCRKMLFKYRAQCKNLKDAAETILRVMIICGIPNYKANNVREVVVKALKDYDIIRYRIDRLPRKRLRKEDLIYRLSCQGQFTRKETQITYAIIRRVFRAIYYGTNECGEIVNTKHQPHHTQECFLVHAAKRIAQIFALIEGMFIETQYIFEDRIKCIFKDFNDKLQERINSFEKVECVCPKCSRPSKKSFSSNIIEKSSKETSSSDFSSDQIPSNRTKFCTKICAEREAEMGKIETEEGIEEYMEEDFEYWIESCNCPKLVCNDDFSIDLRNLLQESSQGPFECKWIPISDTETIWDNICSEPEKYDICIEPNKSSSATMFEHDDFEDGFCYEDEDRYKKLFLDDFDESTRSATISQFSCDRCFRCWSDTDIVGEFEDDISTELTEKSSDPYTRISKQKKKVYDTGFKTDKDLNNLNKGDLDTFDKPGKNGKRVGESDDKFKQDKDKNNEDVSNFEDGKTGGDISKLNKNKDNKNKKGNEGKPLTSKVPGNKISKGDKPNTKGKIDTPKVTGSKTDKEDEPHTGGKIDTPHAPGTKVKTDDEPYFGGNTKIEKEVEPHTGGKTDSPKVPGMKTDKSNMNKNKKEDHQKNNLDKTGTEGEKENHIENDTEHKRLDGSKVSIGDLLHKEKIPKGKTKKKVNINTSKNQIKRPSILTTRDSDATINEEGDTSKITTDIPDKSKIQKTKEPSTTDKITDNGENQTKRGSKDETEIPNKDSDQTTRDSKTKDPKGGKGKFQQRVDKDKTKETPEKRQKQISNKDQDQTTDGSKTNISNQDLVDKNKTQKTKKQITTGNKNKTAGGTSTGFRKQKVEFPRKPFPQSGNKITSNKTRKLLDDNVKKEDPQLKKQTLTPSPSGVSKKTLFPKKILKIKDRKPICCKCIKKKPRKCPCIEP